MADPLATLAEREVPAPTNYFDPAAAQTVISRYGSARRRAESSGAVAEAEAQALGRQALSARAQADEIRLKRDQLAWGREDEDYAARKNALLQQGEFMERLHEIKGDDPEYDSKITSFLGGVPSELLGEPGVKAALLYKNQVADDARARRNAEASKEQSLSNTMAAIDKRAGAGGRFKFIKQEDVTANMLPDGTPNWMAISAIEGERERGYSEGEFTRRQKAGVEGRLQILQAADLSRKGRERRSSVDKYIVEDRASFPRHIDTVIDEYKKANNKTSVDPELVKVSPKWREKFAQAEAWDAKPLDSELSAAFAYDNPEKYVNLVTGLNDSQKERRRMVWEHAHKDGAVEERDAPAEAPKSAPDPNQAALDWLKANPDDPRAEAIRKKLGVK